MRFWNDTQAVANDPNTQGPQVIAAGKWRCATSSLQAAFEKVLDPPLTPSMHGAYVMPHIWKIKVLYYATLEKDQQKRQKMLHQIFDGYNASSDWPGFSFLDDLLDMYPDAKVVLNKRRTPEEWEKSVRDSLAFFATNKYHFLTCLVPTLYWHHQIYRVYAQLAKDRYGVDDNFDSECYIRHNQWVRDVAASRGKQILEWEPSDGWEPLCKFLGRDVPSEPFPRMNETAELKKGTRIFIALGLCAWTVAIGLAIGAAVSVRYIYRSWR